MKERTQGELLKPLFKASSFTTKDVRALGVDPSLLAYYLKIGEIERLERGLYKGRNVSHDELPFQYEDLIYTTLSIPEAVVCLVSALSIYDLTEEVMRKFWIAIPNTKRVPQRKNLKVYRFRDMELGRTSIKYGDIELPIFDKERTVVDAVKLLSRESGLKTLKMYMKKKASHTPDIDKLLSYAEKRKVHSIYNYVEILSI